MIPIYAFRIYKFHATMLCIWFLWNVSVISLDRAPTTRGRYLQAIYDGCGGGMHVRSKQQARAPPPRRARYFWDSVSAVVVLAILQFANEWVGCALVKIHSHWLMVT